MMEKRPKKDDIPPVNPADQVVVRTTDIDDDNVSSPASVAANVSSDARIPVVGIVASAGGLEAFKKFFAAMPSPSGMAFVVVPHLDAHHKSQMVELLARKTKMPVVEATEGMRIEVDSVYIIPPNCNLSVSHGKLRLSDLPQPIGSQTAIDAFLRSLAEDLGERAIGVVFSGTGSHGTLGLREIKRAGGMTMVQSPESAEFDQMPRSAIETGLIDYVLAPESMPEALLSYTNLFLNPSAEPIASTPNIAEQLTTILQLIRARTDYDFQSYRTNMLVRRIERRMGIVQSNDLAKYIDLLERNPVEIDALCRDFLIGVTAFFREPEAFEFLEKDLFPKLVASQRDEIPLRFWVPSCATGEEAYSIAILLLETFAKAGKQPRMQIFASDINQRSIDVARRGVYPASISVDVATEWLRKYFVTFDATHYQVSKQLRESIVFSTHNVINDVPFSNLDMISCRNLMIYLEPEIQQKLISLFHYALIENGHLLLGPAETIGRASNLFDPVSKKWRIYRRHGPGNRGGIRLPEDKANDRRRRRSMESSATIPRKSYKELTESTLRNFTPAAVLINRRYEVLYVSGAIVDYLEFPTGELSKDLLVMARSGLRTRLRAACHKAITQRVLVSDADGRVQRNGVYVACTITAQPIIDPNESDVLVLVLLQDHPVGHASTTTANPKVEFTDANESQNQDSNVLQLLEYELRSTREELLNTIEEMESSNEELQSANEELESSKEELQSLNEELSTVNCQLLEKVNDLDKSNTEISSLMASTEIATLYLDSQLRIKRFTHPTVALFNLVPTDEGRDIRDFASRIVDVHLLDDCLSVLKTQESLESQIYTNDKRCFLRRITPYRTPNHNDDGVVITFIDLTEQNRSEAEQRKRDAWLREIFNHAATGIAITDLAGVISKCNPAFCNLIGYSEQELIGKDFAMLVHPEDQANDNEAVRAIHSGEMSSSEIESRCLHKDGSLVYLRKFVSGLPDGSGKTSQLMALVTDVSVQHKALEALQQSEERIRAILKTASDAIITIDHRGCIDSVNQATQSMFGYSMSELIGKNVSMLMPQPFSREHDGYIARYLKSGQPRIIGIGREVICRRKDGSTFPADLAVSQVDHLERFTGILRDISSRKEMQKHILDIAEEEQRRIGLELHDGTQQELTGLSLYVNAIRETLQRASEVDSERNPVWQFDARSYQRLNEIADLLSLRLTETNQHVRDLAHGIMPVQIDSEGLQSALTDLAKSVNSNERMHCVFECDGEVAIPNNSVATHLYRIAQEAVNNSIRHGAADRIRIFLSLRGDRIALEVNDNGSGLDREAMMQSGLPSKGIGMRAMEYRASLIGGQIRIEHRPEGGTMVGCEILKGGVV